MLAKTEIKYWSFISGVCGYKQLYANLEERLSYFVPIFHEIYTQRFFSHQYPIVLGIFVISQMPQLHSFVHFSPIWRVCPCLLKSAKVSMVLNFLNDFCVGYVSKHSLEDNTKCKCLHLMIIIWSTLTSNHCNLI